uniref:Uncharacterized protein n=1 Tax=Noctiluca scintillans TaxID=2966 RepID=A0A7S1AZ52_NOCSC|mmetsp:Transcript_65791/g.174422  ORF Transcript_65791/g.174422 Transcript_65791/m.174422 type:complete len:110 (+) Transcript_65791:141-470(+)
MGNIVLVESGCCPAAAADMVYDVVDIECILQESPGLQKMEMSHLDMLEKERIDSWDRGPAGAWKYGAQPTAPTLLADCADGGGIHLCSATGDPDSTNPSHVEFHPDRGA